VGLRALLEPTLRCAAARNEGTLTQLTVLPAAGWKMVLIQPAYGTLAGSTVSVRERKRPVAALAFLALSVVALSCIAFMDSYGNGNVELMQQELAAAAADAGNQAAAAQTGKKGDINTYPDWLKTLERNPEWDSSQEQVQQAHLANSAVPYSQKIGSLQGKDFVNDVVGVLHIE
jgi:hypothetical protein